MEDLSLALLWVLKPEPNFTLNCTEILQMEQHVSMRPELARKAALATEPAQQTA